MKITWQDFEKVDMRIGTIVEANEFPEAIKPAYRLKIDFGPEIGTKKTSAQITDTYTKGDLLNRQVVAVVNFPKKQIANFMSECLILGAVDGGNISLLKPDPKIQNGLRIG